jgi:hypothetical protein
MKRKSDTTLCRHENVRPNGKSFDDFVYFLRKLVEMTLKMLLCVHFPQLSGMTNWSDHLQYLFAILLTRPEDRVDVSSPYHLAYLCNKPTLQQQDIYYHCFVKSFYKQILTFYPLWVTNDNFDFYWYGVFPYLLHESFFMLITFFRDVSIPLLFSNKCGPTSKFHFGFPDTRHIKFKSFFKSFLNGNSSEFENLSLFDAQFIYDLLCYSETLTGKTKCYNLKISYPTPKLCPFHYLPGTNIVCCEEPISCPRLQPGEVVTFRFSPTNPLCFLLTIERTKNIHSVHYNFHK